MFPGDSFYSGLVLGPVRLTGSSRQGLDRFSGGADSQGNVGVGVKTIVVLQKYFDLDAFF